MKKLKPYLEVLLLTSIILLIIFISKGIYPFGGNSLIWGDMENQITAFLYHLYDSVLGPKSIFFDFTTSMGINFIGILGYYLISPFSLIVLLCGRDNIYLSISLVIAAKILLASITSMYVIKKSFKNVPDYISVLMSVSYALCGFSIVMYQITSWADIVYLFPLLFIGVKNVLDGKSPSLYITVLSLGLIMCFYLNILLLVYIFTMSLIYLYFYKKDNMKKSILSLGISTVLSALISGFVLIPSYLQIGESGRASFDINFIFNSKISMLSDKVLLFITIGVPLGFLLYYLFNNHKDKFSNYVLINLSLFFLPVLVEPINKMIHLGSYALFPLRTSFMYYFFIIYALLYFINKDKPVKKDIYHNIEYTLITLIYSVGLIITSVLNYRFFQHRISSITLGTHFEVALVVLGFIIASTLITFLMVRKGYSKFDFINLYIMSLVTIICCSFLYFGLTFKFNGTNIKYDSMNDLYKEDLDYYRVKSNYISLIQNYGYISDVNTLDHFTSLTKRDTMYALRRLGYSSYWVKTYSTGGNLFTDAVLGNKYLIEDRKVNNKYYDFVKKIDSIYLYKNNQNVSYGYLLNHNEELDDDVSPTTNINKLYNGLTGKEKIMTKYDTTFTSRNLNIYEENGYTVYELEDEDIRGHLTTNVHVEGKQVLYLFILRNIDNNINRKILNRFNIYVNGMLFKDEYPSEEYNGLIELGTFENEDVRISLELLRDLPLANIEVTSMDLKTYEEFVKNNYVNTNVSYAKDSMTITYNGKAGTLMLPYIYDNNFRVKLNGEKTTLKKVFSDFIGVDVKNGKNEIEITYDHSYLYKFILLSAVSLLVTVLLIKTGLYNKILEIKLLNNIAYYVYMIGYLFIIAGMYVIPLLAFVISFFYRFNL